MSGVVLVALIVVLIFTIGLGFMLLAVSKELDEMRGSIEGIATQIEKVNEDTGECRDAIDECYKELGAKITARSSDIKTVGEEVLTLKKQFYGTADEPEFKRLQTQAYVKLPEEINSLWKHIGNSTVKTRIEEQEGFVGKVTVIEEPERRGKLDD